MATAAISKTRATALKIAHKMMTTQARLFWQIPEGEKNQTSIIQEITIIGRGSDCDIVLPDERVSRQHTEIHFNGESYLISDLGSFNGTYLNGKMLGDTHPLENGDQLQIGPVRLRFELLAIPRQSPRPTLVVPESTSQAYLEISTGTQRGARFDLVKEKMVIGRAGRGESWDIMLQDRAVSRPHAQIVRDADADADEHTLTDLDSANGTLVNGQAITEPQTLKDGDTILFGEDMLVFRIGGS